MYHKFDNVIILGDFNDDMDETIAPDIPGNISSYSSFINDSSHYRPVTLPLSLAGLRSTVSNDNVIDHQMVSNEMAVAYVPNSAKVLSSVATLVSNYGTTTTDHYPVTARYDLNFFTRPIDWQNFTGSVDQSRVSFTWNTNHEINSNYFVLERSRNNIDFTPVDSVQGQGDKRSSTNYVLNFDKPWSGQTHYRLKITGKDSSVSYSQVLTINMKSNSSLLKVNTSNAANTRVEYTVEENKAGTIELVDLSGRVYVRTYTNFTKGLNIRLIDTHRLSAGVYLIRIVHNGTTVTQKVFIGQP
jgi:hypothetical protein